jgi:hypothetical protein
METHFISSNFASLIIGAITLISMLFIIIYYKYLFYKKELIQYEKKVAAAEKAAAEKEKAAAEKAAAEKEKAAAEKAAAEKAYAEKEAAAIMALYTIDEYDLLLSVINNNSPKHCYVLSLYDNRCIFEGTTTKFMKVIDKYTTPRMCVFIEFDNNITSKFRILLPA